MSDGSQNEQQSVPAESAGADASTSQAAAPQASAAPPPAGPGVHPGEPDLHKQAVHDALARYWRANVTIMVVLLSIWAMVSLGCGVLLADVLNQFKLGGFPLGFWFAQQGSILVFVILILVYCILLNGLDRKHHDELQKLRQEGKA